MDNELGETDLLFCVKQKDKCIAILIENKIDACFQPNQLKRYFERGDKGVKEKKWDDYYVCLMAPEFYIENKENFDSNVSLITYEKVKSFFEEKSLIEEKRKKFKINLIKTAIEKARRGYIAITNESVSNFWGQYLKTINSLSNYQISENIKKPAKSDWFYFKEPIIRKPMLLVHKWKTGCLDLEIQVKKKIIDKIVKTINLPENYSYRILGKTFVIRQFVDPIDRFGRFETQKDKVLNSVKKIKEMIAFSEKIYFLFNFI